MYTPLQMAMSLAARGYLVLPVMPNKKTPACPHGVRDATRTADKIFIYFKDNQTNIALAPGKESNLLVVDIDPRNGGLESLEELQSLDKDEVYCGIQTTAGGGYHYYFSYDEEFSRTSKPMPGIDLLSNGNYAIISPSVIDGKYYELDEEQWILKRDLTPMPPMWKKKFLAAKKGRRLGLESLVTSGPGVNIIPEGARNSSLISLAGHLRRVGVSTDGVRAALEAENQARCAIPLESREIASIVRSAENFIPKIDLMGESATEPVLTVVGEDVRKTYFGTDINVLIKNQPKLSWSVKGWIPADGVTMIYGDSGAGKSFVAIDIACNVAMGSPWVGNRTKKAPVFYMCGEGNHGFALRVEAWLKDKGLDQVENFYVSNGPIDLDDVKNTNRIIEAINECTKGPLGLLVVDTVNNHMSGDENSAKDTRSLLNIAKEVVKVVGGSLVFVHHSGKLNPESSRGSSAWRASLDAEIQVKKNVDGDVEVVCKKMKDGEVPSPIKGGISRVNLGRVDDEGDPVGAGIFRVIAESDKDKKEMFKSAWDFNGNELKGERPYVSKIVYDQYLLSTGEVKIELECSDIDATRNGWIASGAFAMKLNLLKPTN